MWTVGDVFAIPTDDGKFAIGQVVGQEPNVLNSASVALFGERVDCVEDVAKVTLSTANVFTVQFVTRDLLDSGVWQIVQRRPVSLPGPHEDKRSSGFVGAKVIGSGILRKFVNAYFGLYPWDEWHEPDYLDKLLIAPDRKPKSVKYRA